MVNRTIDRSRAPLLGNLRTSPCDDSVMHLGLASAVASYSLMAEILLEFRED
jgi:hypothetical protein